MPNKILTLLLCLAFVLAGCQSASEAVEGGTGTEVASPPTLDAMVTAEPSQAASLPATAGTQTSPGTLAKCAVVSSRITPNATEQALFPAVSDADWSQGPDTAAVTFIEYSDFQ